VAGAGTGALMAPSRAIQHPTGSPVNPIWLL